MMLAEGPFSSTPGLLTGMQRQSRAQFLINRRMLWGVPVCDSSAQH